MSNSEALIEQLRRSKPRWKTLAPAACATLALAGLIGFVATLRQGTQADLALRAEQKGRESGVAWVILGSLAFTRRTNLGPYLNPSHQFDSEIA